MPLSDLILWLAHKRTSSRVKFNHVPCSKCNDLQQREVADYMIVSHLIRLSRAACQYCYLLSRAALMCFDKQSRADGELRVWFPTTNDAQGVFQVEEDEQRARDGRIHYLELFTLPDEDTLPNIPQANALPRDTSSDKSFCQALSWITHCRRLHVKCNAQPSLRMPTRVLDLKAVLLSEFQSDDIRLHIPAEDEHSDYVCLSHCWGSSRCSQLTSSITLESNLRGISLSTLPKTFQDAVFVTRRLGFRFLWIDSFCIIQDDDEDWTRESAQMSMVYRNASLTIAATKATNDEERFSGPSQAGKTYELQLKDGKAPIKIYARRRVPHMISMLPELAYNNNVGYRYEGGENTPLLDRGWVYQERMLSRRVLHFGESELHWECLEDTSCECRLTNARMNGYKSSNMTPKQQHQSALDDRFDNEVLYHTRLMERWHLIVEEYSKLSLSYKKDIFPALSGVARQMQPCRQDSYLAGLWRKSLLHDLCWTRYVLDENKPPRRRRRTWRAPTWSWASINSRVSYNMLAAPEASDNLAGSDIISVAEILDCKCVPHGNDPTGRLVSAKINLRSTLVPAKLWIPGNSRSVYPGLDFRDGISADQVVLDVSIDPRVVDLNREHADASFWDSNRIFCLILARRLESYLALVLIKISDEQKLFHRIGFCTIKETAFSEYFHFVNSTILWIV